MRRLAVLAVVAAILLAGCSAPTATTDRPSTPSAGSTPAEVPEATGTPVSTETPTATDAKRTPRPDPDEDVRGWELGYWYGEALSVTASDGYNESERAALVARTMARVERVRGVEFERDVDVSVEPRSKVPTGGGGGDAATVQRVRYRALFLVGDGENASARSNETRQSAVRGFYSIERDEIVLVSSTDTPRVREVTLAHELLHAHQFRHRTFRLKRPVTADSIDAARAAVEGEARLVERLYRDRCAANWSCTGVDRGGGDAGGNRSIHMGLYLLSYFQYAEGREFVAGVYERGGWPAVTDLAGSLPRSSEQIIHPGRDDPPEQVVVHDRSGDEWDRVGTRRDRRSAVVGEDGLATMFMYTAYDDREGAVVPREAFLNVDADGEVNETDPLDYGLNYTTGWAGDALATYRAGGEVAYVWRIRWDDAAEAREFLDGYRRLLRYRGGERVATESGAGYWRLSGPFAGGYYVAVDGRTVTIVHAPSVDDLGDVWRPAERTR